MNDSKVLQGAAKRKPPSAGIGRVKGVPNKHTAELKDMILGALEKAGGLDYLAERAADPRTASAFLTLVGKTLPMTVKGPGEGGAHVFQKIIVEVVKAEK